jgi:hypothetical protein
MHVRPSEAEDTPETEHDPRELTAPRRLVGEDKVLEYEGGKWVSILYTKYPITRNLIMEGDQTNKN